MKFKSSEILNNTCSLAISYSMTSFMILCVFLCRTCDLIGRLPLTLSDGEDERDHGQLNGVIHSHLLLQKSRLLPLVLEKLVSWCVC